MVNFCSGRVEVGSAPDGKSFLKNLLFGNNDLTPLIVPGGEFDFWYARLMVLSMPPLGMSDRVF
jgi:hypothetical protein